MSTLQHIPITTPVAEENWVTNATILWNHRRLLARATLIALLCSVIVAFVIPKRYESVARLMPPDQPSSGTAMLAAIAGRSLAGLGGLGSLAGGLFGSRASDALFIDLLRSRTISDHLIDRFNLQHVYRKRYRVDTAKYLERQTTIVDDKKSGVISITYSDRDRERARAVTQAYLDELNSLVIRSNTSSARRQREFIEKRLSDVKAELQEAEKALGNFSSTNTMLDVKDQAHAMVDASAKLQAEIIVARSGLEGLMQTYGDGNVRVRATRARITSLQKELDKLSGTSTVSAGEGASDNSTAPLYPSLRQLPHLAVPYADLYRRVRVQETVFELLSQQYELARLEEAKDTPVVSVIDAPQVAEKKSFPPRILLILLLTGASVVVVSTSILVSHQLQRIDVDDPRRLLARRIGITIESRLRRVAAVRRGAL